MEQTLRKIQDEAGRLQRHTDKRLLRRLFIFATIAIVVLSILVYKIALGYIALWLALASFAAGLIAGYLIGKVFKMFWHTELRKVALRMDITGFVVLGLYIAAEMNVDRFASVFLSGDTLSAFGLALLFGLLLGRLLAMIRGIRVVLEERNVS